MLLFVDFETQTIFEKIEKSILFSFYGNLVLFVLKRYVCYMLLICWIFSFLGVLGQLLLFWGYRKVVENQFFGSVYLLFSVVKYIYFLLIWEFLPYGLFFLFLRAVTENNCSITLFFSCYPNLLWYFLSSSY